MQVKTFLSPSLKSQSKNGLAQYRLPIIQLLKNHNQCLLTVRFLKLVRTIIDLSKCNFGMLFEAVLVNCMHYPTSCEPFFIIKTNFPEHSYCHTIRVNVLFNYNTYSNDSTKNTPKYKMMCIPIFIIIITNLLIHHLQIIIICSSVF